MNATQNETLSSTRIEYEVDDVDAYAPKIKRVGHVIIRHVQAAKKNGSNGALLPEEFRGCTQAFIDGYMGKPFPYDELDPGTVTYSAEYTRGQYAKTLEPKLPEPDCAY